MTAGASAGLFVRRREGLDREIGGRASAKSSAAGGCGAGGRAARGGAAAETGTSAVAASMTALSGVANQVFLQLAQRTVRPAAPSAASWI